ncbi:MAG: hypothetical protein HYX86_03135 [Chloroflexi bacterium]|nr:hypothetical protein [Chloroflexota bacterium]
MLAGSQEGVLRAVRQVEIHGQRYFDMAISPQAQPEQVLEARLGPESAYPDPQPGDRVRVHFMMRMVVRVEKLQG